MHDPMDIFSESVIFIQWAFFFFRFLVQRLPAIEIDSVESTIDPLAECAIAAQWNFFYYNK